MSKLDPYNDFSSLSQKNKIKTKLDKGNDKINDYKKRIENIKKIYQSYLFKIKKLRGRQKDVILNFIKQEEEREINKIRQKIKDNF